MKNKHKVRNLKISIIVPIYNTDKYLNRCVDSIRNQTYKDLEIILVNDGSTDNSAKICDSYLESDPRVVVIHQENKGLSGARNSGIKKATGDYLGFVDSDDWIDPAMYESLLNIIIEQDVDIAECNILGTKISSPNRSEKGQFIKESRTQALKRIIKNQQFSVCRRLHSKHILTNILFPEGKNSEDVYFSYQVFQKVGSVGFITNNLYFYYLREDSITRGNYSLKSLDSLDAALYLRDQICASEDNNEIKKEAQSLLLKILLYNYKMLNYNGHIDTSFKTRSNLKKLIRQNFKLKHSSVDLILAICLPEKVFQDILILKSKIHR